MITKSLKFGTALGAVAAAIAVFRRLVRSTGRRVPGGLLIANPAAYDAWSHRLLLGSLFGPIAADVARIAPNGARILEVGSGPGHLAGLLAREQQFDVTGVDLDPAMVDRARANATTSHTRFAPEFVVGDVAALPFADDSFELVVSTLSMHHWANKRTGIAEIRRVLRPGGRALLWDFGRRGIPLHRHMPDPVAHIHESGLELVSQEPWPWPWKLRLLNRIELVRPLA